jgi:hypothetical protein
MGRVTRAGHSRSAEQARTRIVRGLYAERDLAALESFRSA